VIRTATSPLRVLKLGGARGAQPGLAVEEIASRVAAGERWLLVHGASAAADALAARLGVRVRASWARTGRRAATATPR